MDNLKKYDEIFMNVFEVKAEDLNDGFTYDDIEVWDSVAHMTLVADLEAEFDILLEMEDMVDLNSYKHGKEILEKYNIKF